MALSAEMRACRERNRNESNTAGEDEPEEREFCCSSRPLAFGWTRAPFACSSTRETHAFVAESLVLACASADLPLLEL